MLNRRYDVEIMDDFSIQDKRIDDALDELKIINTFLGGKRTTRKAFALIRKKKNLFSPFTVLDVGAGGADVFDNEKNTITALDKNHRSCFYLQQHTHISVVCGDAMMLPFKEKSFDIVHASLFLHHFTEQDVVLLLQSFQKISNHAVIVNDLRRSIWAYLGIIFVTKLFSRSAMVKHDGPLSVLRGFTKSEMLTIFRHAGIQRFVLKRTWAFRWLAIIYVS
jgi:2-polyprenyl-3-methyl-5-hydroxy-6-metoxy-1,4-benzoquinol methylase